MKLIATSVVLALALPTAAFADMSDSDYCKLLSKTYRETAGTGSNAVTGQMPEAMASCDSKPATAIPTLTKGLQDRKITVPPRS